MDTKQEVRPYDRNAKKHPKEQLKLIALSLKEYGWQQPIVVDKNNIIIVGHGRWMAYKTYPEGIAEPWIVKADKLTPAQVKGYRLMDNKSNESKWEMSLVVEELQELDKLNFDIDLTGFNKDLLLKADERDDIVPENAPSIAKLGDLWALGEHRVLCGDSTDKEAVERLMDGKKAALCLTDPPYGLGEKKKSGKNDYSVFDDTLENIKEMADNWVPMVREMCNVVVFSPGVTRQWIYPEPNWVICWFYGGGQLRSPWGFNCWQPFLCYGKDPSLASRNGARPDAVDMNTPANAGDINHPCPKPMKLWHWMIDRLSFSKDDLIYDPFLGSGTTIIACEKTGRVCYGMELDPRYTDVIIARWEQYTGNKAILMK